jgi:fumarylacetoacetase
VRTNDTHDPSLRSWVQSASRPGTDFPLQNLPYGVFRRRRTGEDWRVGVAIGDEILDLAAASNAGLLEGAFSAGTPAFGDSLNTLMALGAAAWSALRWQLSDLLSAGTERGALAEQASGELLVPQGQCEMRVPAAIGDYTDFYAALHHATNVGSMFRPDNPLLPNYKWVPIGYHGRSSSIVISGTPVTRPRGQTSSEPSGPPAYGPSRRLDYEAELGFFVGPGNVLGASIGIGEAGEHLFGVCLLNDWSARDVQAWEYQPLGPFLAKNFASTVSPWVVTMEALAPFRAPAYPRASGDPQPLEYLRDTEDQRRGGLDIIIEVLLQSRAMRGRGVPPAVISRGNARDLYWTPAQMLAHHTSGGCNMRPGDLIGSGTVSGQTKESRGCLLELTWRGTEPLVLPGGEPRSFLEDGDEVTLRARCEAEGAIPIGFGPCSGEVLPADAS